MVRGRALEGSSYEARERLAFYRDLVARAIKSKRIFRIVSRGDFTKLRAELFNRKFLEQIVLPRYSPLHDKTLVELVEAADEGNECEKALITRLLGPNVKPSFVWSPKLQYYNLYNSVKHLNRIEFTGDNFSFKDGMIACAKKADTALSEGQERLKYPRAFRISSEEGKREFLAEYDWTMVTSLIWYLHTDKCVETLFSDRHWDLNLDGLRMALKLLASKVDEIELGTDPISLSPHHWRLIRQTYVAVTETRQRMWGSWSVAEFYVKKIHEAAGYILRYWPERRHDGTRNVWMVKPTYSGMGEGIIVTSSTKKMMRYLNLDNRDFVVQKYIERPMLVYGVKFDIRQYFVVSMDEERFCGWAHPLCTIKLASEPFTLTRLDEQIHVTNTSVQMKYKNKASSILPDHHMWSLDDLNWYFKHLGHESMYQEKIFPAIKETLKRICEACSKDIEWRAGRFELMGCDWLITEDFDTQLLEINRNPSLEHYTNTSIVVLGQIMKDLLKVSVDHYYDPLADTGGFEKIYEENISHVVIREESDSGYSSRKSSVESNNGWYTPSKSNFFQL